jgi:hypothetical protein
MIPSPTRMKNSEIVAGRKAHRNNPGNRYQAFFW